MKHLVLGIGLILGAALSAYAPGGEPGAGSSARIEPSADTGNGWEIQGCSGRVLDSDADATVAVTHLLGIEVTNPLSEEVGQVSDLVLDRHGCVTSVVIRVGGFLGVGAEYVHLPLEKVRIEPRGNSSGFVMTVLETRAHILQTRDE